jgi:uncharacterized protein (DUF2235 family)
MAKRLIFLIDGTNNDPTAAADADEYTNVFKLNALFDDYKVCKIDGVDIYEPQFTYYYPGLGTRFTLDNSQKGSGMIGWLNMFSQEYRQKLFGEDIEQLILRCYINICANYKSGDKIYIYGFSRGAVAARILSRFISDLGLLRVKYLYLISTLWERFRVASYLKSTEDYNTEIKQIYSDFSIEHGPNVFWRDCSIEFLGLFDTVSGDFDEKNNEFIVMRDQVVASKVRAAVHLIAMHDYRQTFRLIPLTGGDDDSVRQIWMPGVHSDVGGGYRKCFLSHIALLTMVILSEEIADLAFIEMEKKRIETEIEREREAQRIFVNDEGEDGFRPRPRSEYVAPSDRYHHIHTRMTGRLVRWKGQRRQTEYRRPFPIKHEYGDAKSRLNDWVGSMFP